MNKMRFVYDTPLKGHWEKYEREEHSFNAPTCTDKSKFIPDATAENQYSGSNAGIEPQYDFQDGKITSGFKLHKLRKPGLDIVEITESIDTLAQSFEEGKKELNQEIAKIKQSGAIDKTTESQINSN